MIIWIIFFAILKPNTQGYKYKVHFQSPQSSQGCEENVAIAFQDLVTTQSKHPDNVLLSYLNINSLRYKINDLKILVLEFFTTLPCYLWQQICSFSLKTMTYKILRIKMAEKHGGGLIEFAAKWQISKCKCKRLEVPKNVTSEIVACEITVKGRKWAIGFRMCLQASE